MRFVGGKISNNEDAVAIKTPGAAYLVSGDQLNVTSFFPDTFPETSAGSENRPFCTGCEFLKWGSWGARVEFGNGDE
jgi:hypothetical protein